MRILTSTLAATALLASSTALHAGGLADEIMEAPVVMEEPMMEEPSGSLSPTVIVIGVLAALLLAASLQEEDEGDEGGDEPDIIEVSDMRLKTDITQIGTADNGLAIYSFSYLGSDAVFSGVMAQDVLSHTPDAVVTMPGGFYAVDYGMLGLTMERLN